MTNHNEAATCRAHPNIAFIKYWGNRDEGLRLPANSSISMNLDSLYTETTVEWDSKLTQDELILNGQAETGKSLERVATHLNSIRKHLTINKFAYINSSNNFPMGAGIASSASAFAALTLAAITAADSRLSERETTTLARLGSGSASRSVPGGFVEWHKGESHETSFAESFASENHWDLVDVIAVVSQDHKNTGSTEGHQSANSSDLQQARLAGAETRFATCKNAILKRDFKQLAAVIEYDSNLMHAVMITSRPALLYWQPATISIMKHVSQWREEGIQVCYTLDAGPNVHCICIREDAEVVRQRLQDISGVKDIRTAKAGGGAHVVTPV